jgi:hypothetical protein
MAVMQLEPGDRIKVRLDNGLHVVATIKETITGFLQEGDVLYKAEFAFTGRALKDTCFAECYPGNGDASSTTITESPHA